MYGSTGIASVLLVSKILRDRDSVVEVFSELAQPNGLSSCNTRGISEESLQDMLRSSNRLLITVTVAVVASEFCSVSVGVITFDVVK